MLMLAAVLLHLTVLHRVRIFGASPDLVSALVIFFALFCGPKKGLEAGLAGGLLKDLFSADIFGVNMLVLGITGLTVGALNAKFFKESRTTQFYIVLIFVFLSMAFHFKISVLAAELHGIAFSDYLMHSIVPSGLYTALVSIPIFSKLIAVYGLREPDDLL